MAGEKKENSSEGEKKHKANDRSRRGLPKGFWFAKKRTWVELQQRR